MTEDERRANLIKDVRVLYSSAFNGIMSRYESEELRYEYTSEIAEIKDRLIQYIMEKGE